MMAGFIQYGTMCGSVKVLTSVLLHQDVPVSTGQVENYVLLLVLLSAFAGGTLVLLSLLLLFCHRCCMGGRRYSRCVCVCALLSDMKVWPRLA